MATGKYDGRQRSTCYLHTCVRWARNTSTARNGGDETVTTCKEYVKWNDTTEGRWVHERSDRNEETPE